MFDYELVRVQTDLIVPVGETALQTLLGSKHRIAVDHGKVIKGAPIRKLNQAEDGYIWTHKKYTLFPQYHPAAVFYNRKLAAQIEQDWLIIKDYLEKEKPDE